MKEFGSRYSRGFGSNNRMSFTSPREEKKEVEKKPRLSDAEREERHQQRLADNRNKRIIHKAAIEANKEREKNVTNYSKVGQEYLERFARAELRDQWRKQDRNYMNEIGRVNVEVRNSLQMELRKIELKLDRLVAKYSKKSGNPHIAQGIQKMQQQIEPIIEKGLRELMWYMIEEEHKQNEELIPIVCKYIDKAEDDIGVHLEDRFVGRIVKECVTAVIQGSVTDARLANFVYDKVDYYSRILM